MSRRKAIYSTVVQRCEGGESPNIRVPKITAEVRLHFPNMATEEEVNDALTRAYEFARTQVEEFFE